MDSLNSVLVIGVLLLALLFALSIFGPAGLHALAYTSGRRSLRVSG